MFYNHGYHLRHIPSHVVLAAIVSREFNKLIMQLHVQANFEILNKSDLVLQWFFLWLFLYGILYLT